MLKYICYCKINKAVFGTIQSQQKHLKYSVSVYLRLISQAFFEPRDWLQLNAQNLNEPLVVSGLNPLNLEISKLSTKLN